SPRRAALSPVRNTDLQVLPETNSREGRTSPGHPRTAT
ncbi:hypothetical protein A2U01_0117499, partial [Trifolium medium]|nr:hypothetical protein [Trifolium medium]